LILILFTNSTTKLPDHEDDHFFNLIKGDCYHQSYQIETEDGYVLKLFRVSKSKSFN